MWTVICKPVSDAPLSGLAVVLTDGSEEREVSRVAFIRRESQHPRTGFVAQLQSELDKAEEAATTVNELYQELERLRADALDAARMRIRELLGEPADARGEVALA